MNRPARFNKKAFVSFAVLFIWIIIALTGIVLYFAPPGRIAHWVEWRFLGLTKEGWQAVHTIFALLFIVAAAFHLYYNWVVFWSYLKSKVQAGIKMRRELVWSGILTIVILIMTMGAVPPFSSVMDFGEYLSDSWGNEQDEPPIPHAELLTLKNFAEKTNQDLKAILRSLNREGLKGIDSLAVVGDIAKINNLTPQEVANKISLKSEFSVETGVGSGYGRKTVSEICRELSLKEEAALKRMKNAGIKFKDGDNLRSIANSNNVKPTDIVKIIKGEK